jgi:hypothetical protein
MSTFVNFVAGLLLRTPLEIVVASLRLFVYIITIPIAMPSLRTILETSNQPFEDPDLWASIERLFVSEDSCDHKIPEALVRRPDPSGTWTAQRDRDIA